MNLIDAKHNYGDIYCIKFDDKVVAFRLLSWSEFKRYRELVSELPDSLDIIEDAIYADCVIESAFPDTDTIDAGIITSVVSAIMTLSGSTDIEHFLESLEEFRQFAKYDYEERISALLTQVFHISRDEINKKTWPEILRMISHLELIMMQEIPEFPLVSAQKQNHINFEKDNQEFTE